MQKPPRAALGVILMTVALDAIGIGLIFPVMPDLIGSVTGGSLATAALWGGVLATSYAVMQFIFGPVIGSLSDSYGRRPVLLLSLVVMVFAYLAVALACWQASQARPKPPPPLLSPIFPNRPNVAAALA
jgi:DHA1 family tetracycline resistance protein-like MFS transporter